jgi:hypothetical protein
VRHNDDCTAVCAPREADPNKRRVCSKGCNRKLKVSKLKPKKGATTHADLFDIIVCQVSVKWTTASCASPGGRAVR